MICSLRNDRIFELTIHRGDMTKLRLIAFLILFFPGLLAALGIKYMRDTLFGLLQSPFHLLALQFLCGLILTIGGIAFIAGFILHRDRKRNKVQKRFAKNK